MPVRRRIRKAAAASIPVARLIGGQMSHQHSDDDRRQLCTLGVSFQARVTLHADIDGETLDAYRLKEAAELERLAAAFPTPLTPDAERNLNKTLGMLRSHLCHACPKRSGDPACADEDQDEHDHLAPPACLSEYFSALRFAAMVGEGLLQRAFGRAVPLNLGLDTEFDPAIAGCSASCRPIPGGVVRDRIALVVPQYGVTFAELAATPYILAHEVICHASQNVLGINARADREPADASCPWSEGWMDCVAIDAVNDVLTARKRKGFPVWIAEEAAGCWEAATEAHDSRYRQIDPTRTAYLRQARRGWKQFEIAAIDAGCSNVQADRLRQRFSILYNALHRPSQERELVAGALSLKLAARNRAIHRSVVEAAADLVRTHDAHAFAKEILR
ncbi:MAG: hypothetical protein RIR33_2620 [Pseudomonadota bacterium]|jgi:hypothetical protein